MKRKRLLTKALLTLFAVLFSLTGAKAQKALPYDYGFEDGNLATDGWVLQGATNSNTSIKQDAGIAKSGSYFFSFYYIEQNAYLLSPVLTGTDNGPKVSFFYKEYSNDYGNEQFQVGYTTDASATDASTFTYGDVVTASTSWQKYVQTFPAGTVRIAIKYIYNDCFYLFLDDFSFVDPTAAQKPTNLAATEVGPYSAVLSWEEKGDATAWVLEVTDNDREETTYVDASTNPYKLTGLTPETEYFVRVRPAGDNTAWSDGIFFNTVYTAPAGIAAANITTNSADISWTGDADSYNLRYRSITEGALTFSDNFEEGISQWSIVRNGEGNENTDWRQFDGSFNDKIPAHSGNYMVMSRSWSGSAYNVDNWMISPLVDLGGILKFWVRDDGTYHEHYDIYVSTSTNAISSFTKVYEPGNATNEWTEVTVDLSSFAGQQGYFAFRHTDADQDFLLIDDVTLTAAIVSEWTTVEGATSPYAIEGLTPETTYVAEVQAVYGSIMSEWAGTSFTTPEDIATPSSPNVSNVTKTSAQLAWTENGDATAWEIMLNDDEANLISADSNPFTLTGLAPETAYTAKVRAVKDSKSSKWSNSVSFTTLIAFPAPTGLAVSDVTTSSATISWTADADATGAELQYAVGVLPTEYKYDNETATGTVAAGGAAFDYAVMFPAGSFTGNKLYTVSVFDAAAASGGTLTVYSGGDTAPGTALATKNLTLTGSGTLVDFDFEGLEIDPTKNLWIVATNPGGASVATAADVLNDANGRWLNYGGWMDMANAGVSGRCWLIHANIGTASESELTWTTVADATSPAELTGLTPGTSYAVRVKSLFGTEGVSKWTYTSLTTAEANPVPSDIAANLAADGATLTWEGKGDSYKVRYRSAATKGETYFEDNLSTLDNWTVVTQGEGPGWIITAQGGRNVATTYSWEGGNPYNANNWLISPAVELGGKATFNVDTQTQYPDSYEVLLSTTGTEPADFTTTLQAMATCTPGQVTIDLSAYSGKGHIAIHHVSYDCLLLLVFDFSVYGPDTPAGEWQEIDAAEKTATLSGLATNSAYEYQVQSVKDGNATEWSDAQEFALLTLADDADNKSLLNKFDGKVAHVTLAGRTLYKDGNWNTITLPFALTPAQREASPLADADIRTLSGITVADKLVTLNFTDEGAIETAWGQYYGGVPYIVKWTDGSDIVNPEFVNVTITKSLTDMPAKDNTSGITVTFKGTYAPLPFTEENKSILFVGTGNKLNWPLAGARIGAQRAYFQIAGVTEAQAGIKQFVMGLGDDDPTGIQNVVTGSQTEGWYDLSGRKLAGKPAQKGIYVNGGRKVTVK